MIRFCALVLALSATAACAQPVGAPAAPPPPALAPDTPQTPLPPPLPQTAGRCEAADLAWLIGKPRSLIPVPVDPSHRRVYCSTCIVTQDYWPDRTNIIYDSKTGIVLSVTCG